MAPSLFERSSGGSLCWACSSESEERGRGQGEREGWKVEACRREREEKMDGVYPITLEWDTSEECHPLGGY